MENSYTTLHRNLDNRILTLEKETHPNQTLIKDLKKQKLKLKDKMISHTRELARREKYNSHEYIKRALSMTA